MHILVVNDDGPPSPHSSPYVHSLITTLQSHHHTVSVVLPHIQRSWISKAHIVGATITPTYYNPSTSTTRTTPSPTSSQEEWILIDSTPASCVQIGLHHYFHSRGPVDLVLSGPNYGRNTTSVFALSSGTVGGALEAAVCGKKAIALSYAFFSRDHDQGIIAAASRHSVRIIEHLAGNWGEGVDVYNVNVPLVEGVEGRKVVWTRMLQNEWSSGSSFQEVDVKGGKGGEAPEKAEERIRRRESVGEEDGERMERGGEGGGHIHKHFKWAPRFTDVYDSVEKAGPGNDGWAVKEGMTSVTPLKATFMHAAPCEGELKL